MGMEIYIEYVLIDNLVINALILLCVKNSLKLKSSWLRIFLSSLTGTIVAILLPLFNIDSWLLIIIKLALGVVMVLILSKYFRFKEFLFSFLLFLLFTILLVGACIVTLLSFGTSLEMLTMGAYDIFVPLGVILLIVAVYVYIIVGTAKYLYRKKDLDPFIKEVEIIINGKSYNFKGFLDSGNKLCDRKTGLPVIIVSMKSLEKYFSKEDLENLVLEKESSNNFKNVHLIGYNTVSGEAKKMIVFDADKMVIKSKSQEYTTNRFVVGVTYKVFKDAVNYDLLLSANLI